MNLTTRLACFTAIAMLAASITPAQVLSPGVGATSPNSSNREFETRLELQRIDEQRRLDEMRQRGAQHDPAQQALAQAQVAKFMKAIKRRKPRFPDFDQVVLNSKTPVTPLMLGLIAESPYAADIARK